MGQAAAIGGLLVVLLFVGGTIDRARFARLMPHHRAHA